MKKLVLLLGALFVWTSFWAYYYPNPEITPYLDDVTNKFTQIISLTNTNQDIPSSLFSQMASDFAVLKDKLPQSNPNFKVVYENCYWASKSLADWFSRLKLDTFNSQCFWPWKQVIKNISTNYSVKAKLKAYPQSWNAPLTVTFDARWSVDPSADTIPHDNYFWYYKDSNWVERFIWRWPVIKYTFNEPNNYVVHLTVRSANKTTKGILDGSTYTTISVAPPIAKVVLYINGQRASTDSYVKISTQEAKSWVLFDASWTTPNWWTKIVSSTWTIKKDNKVVFQRTIPDYPGSVRVKLLSNGFYFVTLKIQDNTWKTVTKTFKLIVSNPVALIKVTPTNWDTSTKFLVDGSASYSVAWNINSYKWTIVWPNWNIIDKFQWVKSFRRKFITPWNYSIKLEVTDVEWNKNDASYKLYVNSTPPVANFLYRPYDNWEKPSTFIFDASDSYDVDEKVWDKLSYKWNFSNSKYVKVQSINWWEKIIATFDKIWTYNVTLTVTDKYWKSNSIVKQIKIESILRPKLEINPNYVILWTPIQIKVNTNKPVAYYEYYFWDKKIVKTQSNFVEHTYSRAGIYKLKVVAYSVDWDSNTVYANIFVWQRGYPLAVYKVEEKWKILNPNSYCKIPDSCNASWCKFAPAYEVPREKFITINAKDSINSQWTHDMLSIYFKKSWDNDYTITSKLWTRFDELGCKVVTLYVKDLNNNKIDKKQIYFKVVDALPVLKDLNMYFPQYGWTQNWVFRPNIWNNTLPKDIFSPGFDPLLVKLQAKWAYDPDSPMLSYYRWYYYRKGDKSNLLDVKITPYNIPQVVFSLPRIPGKYIFGVDVCDVDWKCTNSEQYLHLSPIVDIPPSTQNPDIPQVNSVRIDYNWVKWVGEVNVWDKVTIHVSSSILSQKPDFYTSRTIKYDFDNDWKYDLTTKKDTVTHIYKKPWKYRVKVKVIYRGYGWIGYSAPLIVKKWLKPLVDTNAIWKTLIFNDMSMWDIKEKELCFNLQKCKKEPANFLFKTDSYGLVNYETTWLKLLFFKYKDAYGNEKIVKKKLIVKSEPKWSYLLSLPKAQETKDWYLITLAWMYKNSFILYYHSSNKNCYIDQNISVDQDKDWSVSDDKDLQCNHVYKLTYNSLPEVVLLVHDWKDTKKIMVKFTSVQVDIPSKYKTQYDQLQQLIYKYADSPSKKVQSLVKMLSDLQSNLDDVMDRDAILLQLSDYIKTLSWVIPDTDINQIKTIISSLSDVATNAALSKDDTKLKQAKDEIMLLIANDSNKDKLNAAFDKLQQTSSKEERKQQLQSILDIALNENKDWTIDAETLQMVKSDVCSMLKYYEIPSKACWTSLNDVPATTWSSSFGWSILKIILTVLWIFAILFIILVVVFVIKAKKRREEMDNDEQTE